MLGCMTDDEKQNAALSILAAEPVETRLKIGGLKIKA